MNARTQESNLSNGTENNRNLPSNIISTQNYPVSYIYSGHCDNIDERDQDDPLCATEYVEDMYEYFRSSEGDDLSPTKLHGKSAPHQQNNEDNSCWLDCGGSFEVQACSRNALSLCKLN